MSLIGSDAGLLVTTDWLAAHLGEAGIRIVDTRKGDSYKTAHVPGAVRYPESITPFLKENGCVPNPEKFARLMSEIGVGDNDLVVAYDDGNNLFAARLWWALNYYGHKQVAVLDGGWDLWVAEGRAVAAREESLPAARFTPKIEDHWIAEWEKVKAAIDDPDSCLLDVRSDAEWTGADPMGTKRGGHIPSAAHLEWRATIDPATKRFRSSVDLQRMFVSLGLEPDKEVITYCQGGIRAAHTAFALRLAGYARVRNYERSWSEWGNRDDLPIEVPK